jgi:hypothetical protein
MKCCTIGPCYRKFYVADDKESSFDVKELVDDVTFFQRTAN